DLPNVFDRNERLPLDRRVYLVPQAKALITIPLSADKLVVHRFDLDEALEKSGIDYLLVTSPPQTLPERGGTYSYTPVVKSKKGGVKMKLESGPDGMKLVDGNRLQWVVPADFADREVTVLLSIGDATGQEIFHTYKVQVRARD